MPAYYVAGIPYSDELYHFGIKGQKWGIRRYQNPDGSLTPAGKARYGTELERMAAKDAQRVSDAKAAYGVGSRTRVKLIDKEINEKMKNKEYRKAFNEASKHVDVGKSLKKAEELHKHSGTFSHGRDLSERGYSHSKNALKTARNVAISSLLIAGTAYYQKRAFGMDVVPKITLAIGGATILGSVAKSAKNAHDYSYYERNKKF